MPHHEHGTSPEIQRAMQEMMKPYKEVFEKEAERLQLGATGQFPKGKLTEHDEGEIRFAVTVYKGKIVINFGTPVASLGLDVEDARNLADLLLYKAAEAEKANAQDDSRPTA